MSVLKKLVTLMRGSVREIGESVVDANATRIYEQEIVDAKHNVAQARGDLTGVMAKEMQSAREIERLRGEVARYEGLALEALNKQQEGLAEEVAGRVAELEKELDEQTRSHATYAVQVVRLKELIKGAEAKIREHERQIVMAKTTESVYRATRSIADSIDGTGSKLVSAKESLERIRQRHEDLADRMTAAEQLENEVGSKALEAKLAAAGIGEGADRRAAIMARIRSRQAGSTAGADVPPAAQGEPGSA
ncbi:PspA/IM30 family protein [Viridibacterium curvum]|uniref:PspA/IM30 family protein n=1 Tax=Viridibacterium curvum TaxID=1101404 RepID=A0ABP9QYT2_9RHOO